MASSEKAEDALRTIGELAEEIGRPQHILRYWETRFSQLRPLQRAGKRRYYRPGDVALVRRIHDLLANQGYTIRGVQRLLASEQSGGPAARESSPTPGAAPPPSPSDGVPVAPLRVIRERLAKALSADAA